MVVSRLMLFLESSSSLFLTSYKGYFENNLYQAGQPTIVALATIYSIAYILSDCQAVGVLQR